MTTVDNNPGNVSRLKNVIRAGEDPSGGWGKGQRFSIFEDLGSGYRGLFRDLRIKLSGRSRAANFKPLNTLRKLFPVYAPESENDTEAYINSVADELGIGPDEPIPDNDDAVRDLGLAITKYEKGPGYSGLEDFDAINEGFYTSGYNIPDKDVPSLGGIEQIIKYIVDNGLKPDFGPDVV